MPKNTRRRYVWLTASEHQWTMGGAPYHPRVRVAVDEVTVLSPGNGAYCGCHIHTTSPYYTIEVTQNVDEVARRLTAKGWKPRPGRWVWVAETESHS